MQDSKVINPTHQRKSPRVNAAQFTGHHPLVKPHTVGGPFYDDKTVIMTSIGQVEIKIGDWILESEDGQINICTDANFEKYYEPIPT